MLTIEWLSSRLNRALSIHDKILIGLEMPIVNKNCPDCYNDAIIQLIRQKMIMENKSGYKLKPGAVFRYKGKMIDNATITSDAAEWYIGQDLNNRAQFSILAKDYDEYEQGPYKPNSKSEFFKNKGE